MSTYYRHRRTEQTKVPYSFRCEQCMQESGLMLAKIAGMEVTMSSNYNVLTQAQDEKLKQKAHKNLVKRIQEVHKDAVEKEIIAGKDGLVFTLREYPMVSEGALLARILTDIRTKKTKEAE